MKKTLLLCLFFLSFSSNLLAQKKGINQTINKTTSTVQSKKQTTPVIKKDQKPKATMQSKETKGSPTKNEVKKQVQTPLVKKNVLTPSASKHDSVSSKKPSHKQEDTVVNTKLSNQQASDTHKMTNNTVLKSVDTAHNKNDLSANQEEVSLFNFSSILPWGIIVVLIGLFVFVFTRSMKKIETLESLLKQNSHEGLYQVENLKEQIKKAEIEKNNFIQQDQALREELRTERKKNQAQTISQQISQPVLQQETAQPQRQESSTKYARYADQGDGFTVSDLLGEEGNDTIFEITLTSPTTATYKVANNLNAQKYALSNAAYFLGKTCKYDSIPSQNSIIRTDSEGELKLHGGNKWLILNLAKISFI